MTLHTLYESLKMSEDEVELVHRLGNKREAEEILSMMRSNKLFEEAVDDAKHALEEVVDDTKSTLNDVMANAGLIFYSYTFFTFGFTGFRYLVHFN